DHPFDVVVNEGLGHLDLDRQLRYGLSHIFVGQRGDAVQAGSPRHGDQIVDHELEQNDVASDAEAFEVQPCHDDRPTLADLANQAVGRQFDIGKKDLVDFDRVVDRPDVTDLDAGGRQRHRKYRQAVVPRRRRVGTNQGQTHIGPVPVGDPRLLSTDHPPAVIALNAAATYRGDVTSRVRLAEQLTPHVLAAPHCRQQLRFLLFRTEVQQDMCRQVDLIDRTWRAGAEDLFADDAVVQRMVVGAAAMLDRPIGTGKTRVEQGGEPGAQQRFLRGVLGCTVPLARHDSWGVVGDESTHPLPESIELRLAGASDGAYHPETSASSARLDRAVPSDCALVNTRRSSWCSGYSQVKPIPPDSCMHSSTAAVALAATKAWATAVSAAACSSSAATARAAFITAARALTSKTKSSTRRCCTA